MAGMKDVARGFYRQAVPPALTGNIFKHNKITDTFSGIYIKGIQEKSTIDGYGRMYQSMADIELSAGGVGARFLMADEITVYKIQAIMGTESLVWENITDFEVYTKE